MFISLLKLFSCFASFGQESVDKIKQIITMKIYLNNKEVFKEVFEKNYPLICFYVRTILSSEEEAEDIVGELFISLWQQEKVFKNADHLRFFLYKAARNATLNYIKAHKSRVSKHQRAYELSEKTTPDASHALIRAEVMNEILTEIEKLPPQESKILLLTFKNGLGVQQIAEELGLSLQTVKNCKYRATNKLKIRFMGHHHFLIALSIFTLFS